MKGRTIGRKLASAAVSIVSGVGFGIPWHASGGLVTVTPQPVTISSVQGTFYTNAANSGSFDTTQSVVFKQQFPLLAFNPPPATQPCSNVAGVDDNTRPFTDVIPNSDGTCATLVAAGNGAQAGSGGLSNFEAVFTGSLNVAAAGQVNFGVFSDDGFVFAIGPQNGQQPARVSGALVNPPSAGFATGYPVLGAYNTVTAPTPNAMTIAFPASGSYPFEFDYTECCDGQLSLTLTANGALVPPAGAHSTALIYTGDTSADFNDLAHLSARLSDTSVNPAAPIAGAPVTISLGAQTCTATTDATGLASCTVTPNVAAGGYTVSAAYAGDSTHQAANATSAFTVTLEETTLAYTGAVNIANGQPAALAARLLEDSTSAIAGRTVTFTMGSGASAQACSGTTDASGNAGCTIASVAQPLGSGSITARFSGDGFYRPASVSVSALLFALPAGAFVIGDRNAASGATINFWGAQWWRTNSLSGGPAPASFKGFADVLSVTPAACGAHWSTDPGNSAPPPATVPAYMAVIVSSSIAKSGPVLSGNIVEIVIVKTDSGYQGNPGHRGTGQVVAVLCKA